MLPRPKHRFAIPTPPAAPGLRIGLLGGSFNPPHAGHLQMSRIARQRLGLDRVWWLVSPGNPLKRHDGLPPLAARIADARRVAGARWIVPTGFEADLGTAYTAETLAFLKARHPRARFVWLMGADNLATVHHWRNWRQIFRLMPVAVVDRPGWHLRALSSPAARAFADARMAKPWRLTAAKAPAWTFVTGRLSGLSSTALRRAGAS